MKMPTVFFSHGGPERVISDSSCSQFLKNFSKTINQPKGILIISAHWQTADLQLTVPGALSTIYDFSGFSDELYNVKYAAQQTEELTQLVINELQEKGRSVTLDKRGLDHGSWSVLTLAYPKAEIPVANLSLPRYKDMNEYITLGKQLSTLREKGILIIGSGSATHNLGELSLNQPTPEWALSFVDWLHITTDKMDLSALAQIYQQAPNAKRSHPTAEHFTPLLIVAGAAHNEKSKLIHNSYEYSSLNNSAFLFGEPMLTA